MSIHSQLAGLELHEPYHYVQETDPGPVGSGKYWLKVSAGEVKRRNDANSAWTVVGGNPSSVTDPTTTKGDLMVRSTTAVDRLPIGTNGHSLVADSTQALGAKWTKLLPLTTKGDLLGFGTAEDRLPVGTDGWVLTADAASALGIKWAAGGGGGGGISFVTYPASNTASGTAGEMAINSTKTKLAVCVASNDWRAANLSLPYTILTYASNGDTNGILYWLGTSKGTLGWSNPNVSGNCVIVNTALSFGSSSDLSNRASNDWNTQNIANSMVGVDFGPFAALICNKYTIRNRVSASSESLRNWKLQGTNSVASNTVTDWNLATWTDIDTRTADATLNANDVWGAWTVSGTPAAYRYLRILQNGVNSSGTNYLCMGEFEFYGSVV